MGHSSKYSQFKCSSQDWRLLQDIVSYILNYIVRIAVNQTSVNGPWPDMNTA